MKGLGHDKVRPVVVALIVASAAAAAGELRRTEDRPTLRLALKSSQIMARQMLKLQKNMGPTHAEADKGGYKGVKGRSKPGAALAMAKRESAAIVPSRGKKITF